MTHVTAKDATAESQGRAMAELLVSVCICALGLFFFAYAGRIEAWGGKVISPSLIPRIVTALIVVLGLILTIRQAVEVIRLKAQIRHAKIPRSAFTVALPFPLSFSTHPEQQLKPQRSSTAIPWSNKVRPAKP